MSDHKRGSYLGTPQAKQYQHSLAEAHAEIERLRAADQTVKDLVEHHNKREAEIERLRDKVEYWRARDLEGEKIEAELRADNAKLRAAADLAQKNLSAWLAHQYDNNEQWVKLRKARDSLRRALEGGRSNADVVLGPDPLEDKMREGK